MRASAYEPLPPVELKGQPRPVPLWRARRALTQPGQRGEDWQTPFVGRQRERRFLELWERVLADRAPQLATVPLRRPRFAEVLGNHGPGTRRARRSGLVLPIRPCGPGGEAT